MDVLTKQLQIAELAAARPEESFTSLNHYVDMDWMKEAYRRTRRESAAGVDGKTMEQYGKELESNLRDLIGRAKSGRYHAPPVRRVHIPKGDGKETRPIGIPTCQDKVLQRAITMLLEPIYEQDFMESSFGFRPGRSAHDALEYLWKQCMDNQVRWILDVDIRSYFDTLDHAKLREIVSQRVQDGVVRKLIDKWLKAGVMEAGEPRLEYQRLRGTHRRGLEFFSTAAKIREPDSFLREAVLKSGAKWRSGPLWHALESHFETRFDPRWVVSEPAAKNFVY